MARGYTSVHSSTVLTTSGINDLGDGGLFYSCVFWDNR